MLESIIEYANSVARELEIQAGKLDGIDKTPIPSSRISMPSLSPLPPSSSLTQPLPLKPVDESLFISLKNRVSKADILELLNEGANPQSKDENLQTPLHFAAEHNSVTGMKLLLKKGVSLNSMDRNGQTPVLLATLQNNYE